MASPYSILHVNGLFTSMTGWKQHKLVGNGLDNITGELTDKQLLLDGIKRAERGGAATLDVVIYHNNVRPLSCSIEIRRVLCDDLYFGTVSSGLLHFSFTPKAIIVLQQMSSRMKMHTSPLGVEFSWTGSEDAEDTEDRKEESSDGSGDSVSVSWSDDSSLTDELSSTPWPSSIPLIPRKKSKRECLHHMGSTAKRLRRSFFSSSLSTSSDSSGCSQDNLNESE